MAVQKLNSSVVLFGTLDSCTKISLSAWNLSFEDLPVQDNGYHKDFHTHKDKY